MIPSAAAARGRAVALGVLVLLGPPGLELPGSGAAAQPPPSAVPDRSALPTDFDPASGRHVLWQADLGTETYGGVTVDSGQVFVGTNNDNPRDPSIDGDRGVVMAFDAADGRFLWQALHDKLAAGREQDWPAQGVCSTPAVAGDAVYYVSNRAEVVALDREGFADGEDDGASDGALGSEASGGETAEPRPGTARADLLWSFDLIGELGIVPRFMASSSPVVAGDRLFVVTGNGLAPGGEVPSPQAPSFAAFDRRSGRLLWSDASPGADLLDGQWSSPAYGKAGGVEQVVFPGGDGRLYAFDPATGERLWTFDGNRPLEEGGERARESFVGAALFAGGRVYVGMGHDPEWGPGAGRLWAIDAAGRGDLTVSAAAWVLAGDDFGRTLSRPAIDGDLLYMADLTGFLYCIEAATGKVLWKHDTFSAIWSSPVVADGKVLIGDEDGDLAILASGRTLDLLAEINLGDSIYATPAWSDGVLYVATRSKLWAIGRAQASSSPASSAASGSASASSTPLPSSVSFFSAAGSPIATR